MFIVYNFVTLIITLIYLPVYLFKRKFHSGFLLRLGFLPKNLGLERPIWIHAVSVGETILIRGLLDELRSAYPGKKFVISTVTPTGNKIAKSIAQNDDFVTYLPLDFSFIVRYVLDKINPSLFILAETEIWPNLLSCLHKKNIPVAIINARISDRSFRGYSLVKFLLKPVLDKISMFCVQSKRDAKRLALLGVDENKIRVTGNMKFDALTLNRDYTDKRTNLRITPQEKIFVAASTHPGEEEIALRIYKRLSLKFNDFRLLIAPRRPERAAAIEKLVDKFGFFPVRISQLSRIPLAPGAVEGPPASRNPVFILDTIGQLMDFYAISDIVFVGGSLVKTGGHNILEPAIFGKPVFFGPYMFNFRDIAELFLENQAAVMVHNEEELYAKIDDALNNRLDINSISAKQKDLILRNQGATKNTLACIRSLYA